MNAIVVKTSATQTTVKCPYCSKLHTHGGSDIIGEHRRSHCIKINGGEYKIIHISALTK